MTYSSLINEMRAVNAIYKGRFKVKDSDKTILIGTYVVPFKFSEDDWKEAYKFIEEYGMLKANEDFLGDELFYKGLTWDELTDKQKESIIDSYEDYKKYLCDESEWADRFSHNVSFLTF